MFFSVSPSEATQEREWRIDPPGTTFIYEVFVLFHGRLPALLLLPVPAFSFYHPGPSGLWVTNWPPSRIEMTRNVLISQCLTVGRAQPCVQPRVGSFALKNLVSTLKVIV